MTLVFERRAARIALVLALAAASPLRAQADTAAFVAPNTAEWAHCRDTLDTDNLSRFIVAQEVVSQDTTPAIVAQVSLLAQRIAEGARRALGARDESLPRGDSLGMFRASSQEVPVDIVLHRDRPATWRTTTPDSRATSPKLTAFYLWVLKSIPSDSLWIVWPDGFAPDSIILHVDLESYHENMQMSDLKTASFMVFIARGVLEGPARIRDKGPLVYPSDPGFANFSGQVVLQYVVDTSGRVDTTTIRVLEPTAAFLDSTRSGQFYREFIQSSRNSVVQTQYLPAHVGGCPMRQQVRAEFTYPERHP